MWERKIRADYFRSFLSLAETMIKAKKRRSPYEPLLNILVSQTIKT
jgi:hypothetical protein